MRRLKSPRPNQPVHLKRVKYEGRSKTAPYREVSLPLAPLHTAKPPRRVGYRLVERRIALCIFDDRPRA